MRWSPSGRLLVHAAWQLFTGDITILAPALISLSNYRKVASQCKLAMGIQLLSSRHRSLWSLLGVIDLPTGKHAVHPTTQSVIPTTHSAKHCLDSTLSGHAYAGGGSTTHNSHKMSHYDEYLCMMYTHRNTRWAQHHQDKHRSTPGAQLHSASRGGCSLHFPPNTDL